MKLRSYLVAGATAIGMALPTIAAAQTLAQVTTDLNLRTGPGSNHAVIGAMPRGAQVHVHQCPGSWCQVTYGGTTGWASQRYLSTGVAMQPRIYAAPQPQVRFGLNIGPSYRDVGPRYRYGSRYDRRSMRAGWYDDHYYDGRRWYYDGGWYDRPRTGFSFSFGN
jgi:uncharacterized protein YraI